MKKKGKSRKKLAFGITVCYNDKLNGQQSVKS